MDLVTGAMGNLAPKLLQLLQDEYKLQTGVKKKIKFLSDELESIHGVLREVAAVPPDQLDEQFKIWARQVREASYDMEDVLDTFLVPLEECPGPADQGRLKRTLQKMGKLFTKGKARHDIASTMEDIKKQLEEVGKRREKYKVDEIVAKPTATSTIDPRLEAMYKEVTQLVGIDKAMGELERMLSLQGDEVSSEKLKIVSVLGIGGLGKTTLAKAVYDKLKPQFDCGAFVSVGRYHNLKKVFRDILIDLDKNKYMDVNISMLDERQLINELRDLLGSKRYFIVFDDIWEAQSWDRIKLALVENKRGSRIISTTRKLEVTCGEVYKLKPLPHGNSKRLFYTRIFGGEGKFLDNQDDKVSDKILKKCGGVPLAIITMASLLVGKSRQEWSEVCNSIGFGDKDIEKVDITMWILSLSYYDLPCHLRTCLLYLSTFPEDYVIDKNSLIWKWVAEGFICKKPGIGLFEVGEGYFNELINRSMIQSVESEHDGTIYGCRVHHMVLDFLRRIAREENFATVLGNDEDTISISSAPRLAHENRIIEYGHLDNHKGLRKLRSFIAHSCRADKGLSLLNFKLLRVLVLEDVYMDGCCHVKHIGNLLLLRYLGLRRTNTSELPIEIGALKFLQTLDLEETCIKELPSSISQLTQLLCIRARETSMPDGIIKKLTSLEELHIRFNKDYMSRGQFVKELANLSELRVLQITMHMEMDELQSDFLQSVKDLHKIQSLTLWSGICLTDLDKATCKAVVLPRNLRHLLVPHLRFSLLPSCINASCLPNISHLRLSVTTMDEQGMKILGGLPELRCLELSTMSTVTVANIAIDGCFQKLRSCQLFGSMVQFVLNDDSSISFTIWNGIDDISFGSRKKDGCRTGPPVMPNLNELSFEVHVLSMREYKVSYDNLGLEYLTSLQEVKVHFNCEDSSHIEVREAKTALMHAISIHPNHPTLILNTSEGFQKFVQMLKQDQIGEDEEEMMGSSEGTTEAPVSSSLGAMGPLFRKLDLLLAREYPLRRSLKHAIKLLKEDLEEVSAALVEQSMIAFPNHRGKYWIDEVRELSYDVEDSIDVMTSSRNAVDAKVRSIQCHRVARLKIRRLPRVLKPSTRIARVAELRTRLHEARERYERYQLGGCVVHKPRFVVSGLSSRVPVGYEFAADLVGIDGSQNELAAWLMDQAEQQLQVMCIVGAAGVGKTALAKELYRELGRQFDCRAFIRVSRKPDMRRLLGDILSQVQRPKRNSDACSVQDIIDNIREHLHNKRYFIVIDDLWEAEAWDIMNNAFPKGNSCSRIIITGEVKGVAADCCGYHSVDTFELKPLDDQNSEKLIVDRICISKHQCPDQLKELSYAILKKCGGLPLAIIAVASLLASQPDNSDLRHHLQQCLFSSLKNHTSEEMLKEIVDLCYSSLPQDLKTCLLYLRIYPEGCTIWKVDLLKQWIAEDFIIPAEGKEEVADSYFDELVNRGMIQPEQINHNGEVLSCTVHHIVFDLITHKSREENFITAVDYSQAITGFSVKARRLSLHVSCAQYAAKPEGIRLSQVRSLAFFGLLKCMPSVMEFKLLGVLILEFWGNYGESSCLDLSRICRLFQLRYLKISSDILVKLPSRIQGLKFLETMEIDAKVSAVPIDIVSLPGLLHLSLQGSTKLPEGIGRITSLQTLQYFDLGNNTEDNVRSLGQLINLLDLHLTCSTVLSDEHLKRNLVALASSLETLTNLRSLRLAPSAVGMTVFVHHSSTMFSIPTFLQRLELLPPIFIFARLPEWIGKLHNLRILKIMVRVLLRSDIDILTVLPDLTVLSLHVQQPNAETVVFNNGALPALKYLKYKCGALCLAFQEEALPNLQRLKVSFNMHRAEQYSFMLAGIEHLLNLKEVTAKIGAAVGAKEFDRRAAESAFKDAIRKHPRFPIRLYIKWVGRVQQNSRLIRSVHGILYLVLVTVAICGFYFYRWGSV